MTRIIFVNSPILIHEPARHIPYGIGILSALAYGTGFEVGILDANAFRLNRELIRRYLISEDSDKPIDIIGLSGLVTTYGFQKEIISCIRKDLPDTLIVAGGGCASSIPREMLEWVPELDMVCVGEGEKTFIEILNHLEDRDFSRVEGIYYKADLQDWSGMHHKQHKKMERGTRQMMTARARGEVEIIKNPQRPLMTEEELNDLPYPAWSLLPMEEVYFPNSPLELSDEALQCKRRLDVISERGCPYQCTFCHHNYMGGDLLPDGTRLEPFVRWQSARYVVDMIKYARIKMSIDFVSFLDENFLANKKRALEICRLLGEEDLVGAMKWGCLGGPQTVDAELLGRLKEAGCTYISYGFESANKDRLKEIRKPHTVDQMQKALDMTVKAGISLIAAFMVGYAGETFESIYDTVKFWVRNGIQCAPFFITPYPATELFEKNKEKILSQYDGDYQKFVEALGDSYKYIVNLTSFSVPEILGLRDLMVTHDLKRIREYAKSQGVEIKDEESTSAPEDGC